MNSEPHDAPFRIALPTKRLTWILFGALAFLIAADLWFMYLRFDGDRAPWSLDELFNVDEEHTLPTWFSSFTMALAATLSLAIAGAAQRRRDRDALYWYGLAIGFGLMSLDDVAGVHETINTYLSIPWTVPGMILSAAIGIFYLGFLWRLPARTRWLFIVAGACFVGGEMAIQYYINHWLFTHSMDSFAYNLLAAIDKTFKMGGVVLFVHALLDHMRKTSGREAAIELEPRG